jgi:hypothetical protein
VKIFADYHHGGLYHALHLLFEKRLGHELFRPIGMEWAEQGIWQYSQNPPTQRQYLDPVNCELRPDGYYYWRDTGEEIDHKCLTFDQFQAMDIDLIIGSVCQHELSFAYLRSRYKPKAKIIRLLGNSGEPIDWSISRNIIDTTNLYEGPLNINRVVIHQEFPDHLFYYQDPPAVKRIRNYLNCFNETPFYQIWHTYKKLMPDFEWKMHGLNGDDGFITPVSALAQSMRETSFLWHIKSHGEGYGHIVHNAFAVGRPVITVSSYYKGKMIYPFLEDGVTCIDLGQNTLEENVKKIRFYSEPTELKKMSLACYKRFHDNVDFAADAEKVKDFLAKLI